MGQISISEKLENLLGLSSRMTNTLLMIFSKAYIHEISERALDNSNGKLEEFNVDIPHVAKLYMVRKNNDISVVRVDVYPEFKTNIIKAINTGESPLLSEVSRKTVSTLRRRYDSLL